MLRKRAYPYEYIDTWEKFDETSTRPKEAYYSKLNEDGISDADYAHVQKVWEVFEIKDIGENHDLYVQSDTLLLQKCFKILEISVLKYIDLILLSFFLHLD